MEGWLNIDSSLGSKGFPCHPDLIADVRELPFGDDSADAVYCGHILEHLELDTVVTALNEVKRVLRPGGRMAVVGPDFDRAEKDWPEMCTSIWPGTLGEWSSWPGAGHQWCATGANSLSLVREVFPDAEEVPIADLVPYWPAVAFLGWQFAIVAA